MITLYIDTSDRQRVSVRLDGDRGDELVQTGESQTVVSAIMELLLRNNLSVTNITDISVNAGPVGSFTGLRVGVSVANTLGFLLGVSVNGVRDIPVTPVFMASKFD